jgi:dTDP-glucose 4,6-dehydratase
MRRDVRVKVIAITGGAGFIGSNFIKYMLDKYHNYLIVNIDSLAYAGNLENLEDVADNANYIFVKADIRDRGMIEDVFKKYAISSVVNFAAESHVDRSIEEPETFLSTNVMGTQVLLDVAKKHWKYNADDKYCKKYKPEVKFLQISTDEVYGTLPEEGKFVETMPLMPNSPYAASKASADMFVRAYNETYGLPVNITRCSNNYGPYQFPEKLIPLIINNCLKEKEIPVYGDGMQVRDWLHVADHCHAIDLVLHAGNDGQIYNVGGNNEKFNIDVVKLILKYLGKPDSLIKYIIDRPGHDRRYAIDNTKIKVELGWKPLYSFKEGFEETIEWYMANGKWIENVTSGDYQSYYSKMYSNR